MKRFFTTLIFVIPVLGYSITNDRTGKSSSIVMEGIDPQATNVKDGQGWKQGKWIVLGKHMPEKNYPPEGKIEEGTYLDDKKTGEWIMYHTDGITPRTRGNFENGRPKGGYIKFDETGAKKEEGTFANGKQSGSFTTYYPNGQAAQVKTFNAEGKEDGPVVYYHENGQKEFEFNKVNGVTTGEATRYHEDGSVKEKIVYSGDGSVASTTVVNETPAGGTVAKVETGSGGPDGKGGVTKDGKKFAAEGYNKLYNKADELWMDGQFKGAKLWDGKLYKYDSDGILLKIEIWKNGAYHSDGQL